MYFNSEIIITGSFIFFFASFIHGSIGFGFSMIATPLLSIFTDVQTAIMLTLIPTLLINLSSIMSEGSIINAFKRYVPLSIMAMLGSGIGTQILIHSSSNIFKLLLGCAILLYLIVENANFHFLWIKDNQNIAKYFFGLCAGILGGLTNVMAPILIIYFLEAEYSKKEIIQALNICFLSGKIIQITLFSLNSNFIEASLGTSLFLLFISSFSLWTGIALKKRINEKNYKNLLKGLLLTLSGILFFQVSMQKS